MLLSPPQQLQPTHSFSGMRVYVCMHVRMLCVSVCTHVCYVTLSSPGHHNQLLPRAQWFVLSAENLLREWWGGWGRQQGEGLLRDQRMREKQGQRA